MKEVKKMTENAEELDKEALLYVRSKWPGAEWAQIHVRTLDILRVKQDEQTCAECTGKGACPLRYYPLVLCEEQAGAETYILRAGKCGSAAALKSMKESQSGDLIKASGLTLQQQAQTFEAFDVDADEAEPLAALAQALLAAKTGKWLVLAGKQGTGKSHLAAAIMLEIMRRGVPALFQSVSAMLDDLRAGYEDNSHYTKMNLLKNVPCLVLDDLGKERANETGMDYLHQIIEFRSLRRAERQTIVTTNAPDQKELGKWYPSEWWDRFTKPILSRLNESGRWCIIKQAPDYRIKIAKGKAGTMKLPFSAA